MEKQDRFNLSANFSPLFVLFGLAAALANNGVMWLTSGLSLGLYLDTVFTVAVTFLAGFLPGIICAVLTTVIYSLIYFLVWNAPYYWIWYFYILCSVAAVFLAALFARFFREECEMVRMPGIKDTALMTPAAGSGKQRLFAVIIMLAILSAAMCVLLSIVGGIISAVINMASNVVPEDVPPETWLRMGFIRQGFGLTASEILSRIPVNMADRPISVFFGYTIAFIIKKIFR